MSEIITPCSFTKESLSEQFRNDYWLNNDEEIHDWEFIGEKLVLHIRKIFKFNNTYCSQCGKDLGPGDHGFSHCEDHK